jgi:drug/metabolite transporter (DMT)-like permease
MARKPVLDATGLVLLLGVSLTFALNQVIVKIVNHGLQPVFFAGLRSALAVFFVWGWMWWRGAPPRLRRASLGTGLLMGTAFAAEFLFLFLAIDLTSVGKAAVIFYSMPLWFSLLAHFGLVGERITKLKGIGLALAFAGTALAILTSLRGGHGTLAGDLCALGGAMCWALTAFLARRPVMRAEGPEMQLFWMVLVSAPLLLVASPLFGDLIRDLRAIHLFWLVIQASVVVTGAFILWLWLLSVYPVSTVASFSFLTPVFSLALGAVFFGEKISPMLAVGAAMVGLGIVLINRPVRKSPPATQVRSAAE